MTELAHKIRPDALEIAEDCANSPYLTKPVSELGCAFDAQWELGFPHALRDALGLRGAPTLAGVRYELERQYNGNAFEKIIFSDSHDTGQKRRLFRFQDEAGKRDAAESSSRKQLAAGRCHNLDRSWYTDATTGARVHAEALNDWKELEWDKAESYAGIVTAHQHLIELRLNRHNNTAGLKGQHTAIFHQSDDNAVMGYHRWENGGPGDDTLIIVNFGDKAHDIYHLSLPVAGKWTVRFNSSWKGYSPDFHEVRITHAKTNGHGVATLKLAPYCSVLSQD